MKKLPLLLFLISFCLAGFSQNNYVPAKILMNSGDTLIGQINHMEWVQNPQEIDFKGSGSKEKSTSISVSDFKELYFENKKYIARDVVYDAAPFKTNELTQSKEAIPVKETILLEVLFEGTKSLFFFQDQTDKRHYFILLEDSIAELIHRKYITQNKNKKDVIGVNYLFRNMLSLYFKDCPAMTSELVDLQYTKKDLTKAFNRYYACSKADYNSYQDVKVNPFEFYFGMGVIFSDLKFNGTSPVSRLPRMDFENQSSFTASIGVALSLPKRLNRLSAKLDVDYFAFETTGYSEYTDYRNIYYEEEAHFSQAYFNLNVLLKYRFDLGEFHPYANAGLQLGFALTNENNLISQSYLQGNELHYQESAALKNPKTSQEGFVLGAGLEYKMLYIDYRYGLSNGMSGYVTLPSRIYTNRILIGWHLKL